MIIEVTYESCWRNSFLDGSNNEPLPSGGRNFIGSMTSLKNQENYILRSITHDTVMGVLNRVIGDQRKLYQSRKHEAYYFKDLEALITFVDKPDYVNQEMAFVRNISGSKDRNAYTGMIKVDDPIFCSDYSPQLWGLLALDIDGLCKFVLEEELVESRIEHNPLIIIGRLEEIFKLKSIPNDGVVNECLNVHKHKFEKLNGLNEKNEVLPIKLYCSALYLQLERLSNKFTVSSARTRTGKLVGISKNSFTKKDFMARYTSGDQKKIWGNPYIRKEKIKGVGEVVSLLEKAGGKLIINIDIDREKSIDFRDKIDCAAVSPFYLGKKGLAYISHIDIR